MTFAELTADLQVMYYDKNKEVVVYFDFPPDGRNKKYRIVSISATGIMIRNDEVERPKGHA